MPQIVRVGASGSTIESVDAFVEELRTTLGRDKINVNIEQRNVNPGYTRVYFGKGTNVRDFDLFLDLKIGKDSPGGSVIFSDTSKGNTPFPVGYSVLNVAENLRESTITTTKDTFANYVRALYDRATKEHRNVQDLTYTVAQEGDPSRGLPGLAAIVTPSANESTMEYVSRLVAVSGKFEDSYQRDARVKELLHLASSPAATPEIRQLALYGLRKDYLQPLTRYGTESAAQEQMGEVGRYPLSKYFSKRRSMFDTGSFADVAYTYDEGSSQISRIQPREPTAGQGVREGFIRSLITFPGESTPRVGVASRQLFSDMPDISGALVMSSEAGYHPGDAVKGEEFISSLTKEWQKSGGAETITWGEGKYRVERNFADPNKPTFRKLIPITNLGERQRLRGELGISNVNDFYKVFGVAGKAKEGVDFREFENKQIAGSGGSFVFGTLGYKNVVGSEDKDNYPIIMGRYRKGDSHVRVGNKLYYVDAQDPDKPIFKEVVKALMERKDYDIIGGKLRVHLPMYYNPETGDFMNTPRRGYLRTDELKTRLEELYKDKVDILQYASSGVGGEESPASMYAVMEALTDISVAHKGSGYKAFATPAFMKLQTLVETTGGGSKAIDIDYANAEFKELEKIAIGTFGTYNLKTARNFVELFAPAGNAKQVAGRTALLEHIDKNSGTLVLSSDEMADAWNLATNEGVTPERLFGTMLKNAANVSTVDADSMLHEFGLAFPVEGQYQAGVYSKETASALLKEAQASGGADLFSVTPLEGTEDFVTIGYKIPGREAGKLSGAIVANAFNTLVPEYPSKKQGVNVAAVMAMIQRYPEGARHLGILEETVTSAGQTRMYSRGIGGGDVPPSDKAMFGLTMWHSYQRELSNFESSRPRNSILLNEKLAILINNAFANVQKNAGTDKSQLDVLQKEFDAIDRYNQTLDRASRMYPINRSLSTSMIYARNQYTLAPALEWIKGIEHYGGGLQEETSQTYYGKQFMTLLSSMVGASQSVQNVSLGMVASARDILFNRIEKQLSGSSGPEINAGDAGTGSKQLKRLFTRANVPGAITARYQEAKALPPLYQVVSERDLHNIVVKNKTVSSDTEYRELKKWMENTPGAYIPGYAQRFPDVSAEHQMLPVKIITQSMLKNLNPNLAIPDRMGVNKGLYVSYVQNELQVGDMDADISQTLSERLVKTADGTWEVDDEKAKGEWKERFSEYTNDPFNYFQKVLGGMFGSKSKDLNIATKTMRDYVEAIKKGKYVIQKRMGERRFVTADELRVGMEMEAHSKRGMGAAYNARRFLFDIADTVLGTSADPEIQKLRDKAYESQSLNYQIYLDRLVEGSGGFGVFEEVSRTANISLSEGYNPDDPNYRVNFRLTRQGLQDLDDPKAKTWTLPTFQKGTRATDIGLRAFADQAAQQSEDKVSNASLAWNFAARGHETEVFQALESRGEMERRWVLAQMADKGAVGLDSPAYLMMAYSEVQRFAKKYPGMVDNENIQIPWINNEVMPVRDIMKTDEFKTASVLEKIYIKRPDLLSPAEIDMLEKMDPTRSVIAALGIGVYAKELTGGKADVTARDRDRDHKMLQNVFRDIVKGKKRIHASQLGNLIELAGGSYEGWAGLDPRFRGSEIFKAVAANTPSLRGLISNRDDIIQGRTLFLSKAEIDHALETGDIDYTTPTTEPIEAGKRYEEAFTRSLDDKPFEYRMNAGKGKKVKVELSHIGQGTAMEYELADGLTIAGTPDYIGYDKATGSFTIVDTKFAANDVNSVEHGYKSLKNVRSYKNRVQQLAYARGFEDYARRTEHFTMDSEFAQLLKSWGMTDEKQIQDMYLAARAGKFKIFIQPGSAEGGLRRDVPIEINYGEKERQELATIGNIVKKSVLSPKMWQSVISEIYTASNAKPGSVESIPMSLRAGFDRTGETFSPEMKKALQTWINLPFKRLAEGGKVARGEKIRVGEGGPEEIYVDDIGEINVIPTHMMTENRLSQSQQQYASGRRLAETPKTGRGRSEENESPFSGQTLQGNTPPTQTAGGGSGGQQPPVNPPPPASATTPAPAPGGGNWDALIKAIEALTKSSETQAAATTRLNDYLEDKEPAQSTSRSFGPSKVPSRFNIEADLAKARSTFSAGTEAAQSLYRDVLEETVQSLPQLSEEDQARMFTQTGELRSPTDLLKNFKGEPKLWQRFVAPILAKYSKSLGAGAVNKADKAAARAAQIFADPVLQGLAPPDLRPIPGGSEAQRDVYGAIEMAKRTETGIPSANPMMEANLSRYDVLANIMRDMEISPEDVKSHPILKASEKTFTEYVDALRKEIDVTKKLSEAKQGSLQEFKLQSEQNKTILDLDIAKQRALTEDLQRKLPPTMYDQGTGQVKSTEQLMAAWKAGEISGPELEQGIQYGQELGDLSKLEKKREAMQGAPFGRGIQSLARHMLGGWGIFYMGTLAGLGTSEMQQGYKETEMAEEAAYGAGARYLGAGVGVGTRTEQQYANLIGAGGNIPWQSWRKFSGQWGAAGLSDISGAAMKGLGGAALSLYLGNMATEAGTSANLPGLMKAGAFISAAAPVVGLATVAGTLGWQQMAYRNAPTQTGVSIAASELRARGYDAENNQLMAFVERLGAGWKGLSAQPQPLSDLFNATALPQLKENRWTPVVASTFVTGADVVGIKGGAIGVPGGSQKENFESVIGYYYQAGQQKNWITAGQAGAYGITPGIEGKPYVKLSEEEFDKWGQTPGVDKWGFYENQDQMKEFLSTIQNAPMQGNVADTLLRLTDMLKQNPEAFGMLNKQGQMAMLDTMVKGELAFTPYAPEVGYSVAARWMGAGRQWDKEKMAEEMAAAQQGLGWEEFGTRMASAIGGASTTLSDVSDMIDMLREAQLSPNELNGMKGTFEFIASIPDMLGEYAKSDNKEQYLRGAFSRYGAIAGTVAEQPFISTWNQYQAARAVGLQAPGLAQQMDRMQVMAAEGRIPTTQEMISYQRGISASRLVSDIGESNIVSMTARGIAQPQAEALQAMVGAGGFRATRELQQTLGGNPLYFTNIASRFPSFGRMAIQGLGGVSGNMNDLAISGQDMSGQLNNRGLWETSFWQGGQTPSETISGIFGQNWQQSDAYGFLGNAVNGSIIPGFEALGEVGGLQSLRLQQQAIQYAARRASVGAQMAQIALQKSFTTGVGISQYAGITNPQTGEAFGFNTGPTSFNVAGIGGFTSQGGGFWGMEDAQRAMQRMQTEANFAMQQRQMQLQTQQFNQNMAMNIQQNQVQRGWARQDWSTNAEVRGMQWGWRLEDFQENARFMTGRDRRLAERQMQRETTMHGVEENQIERQQNRQKELWKMEDARFALQRKQFADSRQLQEEAMAQERAFFTERIRMEDEQVAMQRAYWTKQMELQAGAVGAQAAYADQLEDIDKKMLILSENSKSVRSLFDLFIEFFMTELPEGFDALYEAWVHFQNRAYEYTGSGGTSSGGDSDKLSYRASGGRVSAGQAYIVGEVEPEVFEPDAAGNIIPLHRYGTNPWNASVQTSQILGAGEKQPITLVINLGNHRLAKYVIDAVDQEIDL